MSIINDGIIPEDTEDLRESLYMFWTRRRSQEAWIQYVWDKAVLTNEIHIYWISQGERISLPVSYKISYLDGEEYVPVKITSGAEPEANILNVISIEEVETTSIRLKVENEERQASAIFEWEIISSDPARKYAPVVDAGIDRSVIIGGSTYLRAVINLSAR